MKNKCIICGSNKIKTLSSFVGSFLADRMFNGEEKKTDFLVCKNCKINYFSLRPSDEEMARYYKNYMKEEYIQHRSKFNEGFAEYRKNYDKNEYIKELDSRKKNMEMIFKKYVDFENVKNVLDYGGDRGEFIIDDFEKADKYVYEISGVEPIDGIKLITEQKELGNIKWDFVLCNHVLEHVSFPLEIINHISSILNKNGFLYIEVPYEDYWENERGLKEFLRRPRSLFTSRNSYGMHEHINCFRNKTFDFICKSLGLKILVNKVIEQKDLFGQNTVICCLAQKTF